MHSMNQEVRRVIGGVDSHADTHQAAALDERGRLLGSKSFAVSAAGYRELQAWLASFGLIDRVGVESTGSYAAGLTRHLLAEGVRVLEVNQPHAHSRRRRGKTDAIDAELAARHALSLASAVTPKQSSGIVESIRQLRVARGSAVKSRSAAIVQLGDLVRTAPSELPNSLRSAARSRAKPGSVVGCAPTPTGSASRRTRRSSLCAASRAASQAWTRRSPSSTGSWRRSSRLRLHARQRCLGSRPDTRASC
jgi:hypothetical protein